MSTNIFNSDDYYYYPTYDLINYDATYINSKDLSELKKICDSSEDYIAFNTFGYIKHSIFYCCDEGNVFIRLSKPQCFTENDGLYVKKNNKILNDFIKLNIPEIINSDNILVYDPERELKLQNSILTNSNNLVIKPKSQTDKPFLILCMIVKDESHVIEETLRNLTPYIDYYVINDTGSTDNTIEIIKNYFDSVNIKGEIIKHEFRSCSLECHGSEYKKYSFFHFGWNRSFALKQCQGKSEYIMMFDADDLIVGQMLFPKDMTSDCYTATVGNDFVYSRPLIFKNDPKYNWHYNDALHEHADCDKKNYTRGKIEGNYYINSRRLGSRNKISDKYAKDISIFKELLLNDPTNSRYVFYCAQSYIDNCEYKEAAELYEKRTKMGGWYEEVFYSYLQWAKCFTNLSYHWEIIERIYLEANNKCSMRGPEALYYVAVHYRSINNYKMGYKYAKKAASTPFPIDCHLFIDKSIYEWKCLEELSLNAYYLNKYYESESIIKKLLQKKNIPNDDYIRLMSSYKFTHDKVSKIDRPTCCIYMGNATFKHNNNHDMFFKQISIKYKLIIVGNKIDIYSDPNTDYIFENTENIKNLVVDHLILYNCINYYYDNILITSTDITLLLLDPYIKIITNNGMYIRIYNNDYLNDIFSTKTNKIKHIVFAAPNDNKQIFYDKFSKKYNQAANVLVESIKYINLTNEYEVLNLLDKKKNKNTTYKFDLVAKFTETNGLCYMEPNYLINKSFGKEFMEKTCNNFYTSIIRQFPNMIEHRLKLILSMLQLDVITASIIKIINNQINIINRNIKNKLKFNWLSGALNISKANILYIDSKYNESYNMANCVLQLDNNWSNKFTNYAINVRDKNIEFIKNDFLTYDKPKVTSLTSFKKSNEIKILFSITTGNNFDSFERTINSFLYSCLDYKLIDYWLCVDDNSSLQDKIKMKQLYPFMNFIFNDSKQKSQHTSMNIIRNFAIKNNVQYILYLQNNWHFIQKRLYIEQSKNILQENPMFGQVLFNNKYAEVEDYKKRSIPGILNVTKDGIKYYLHEYYPNNHVNYSKYIKKYEKCQNYISWPHYSFKPSLIKCQILQEVGEFENSKDCELDYAVKYTNKGYLTTSLDTFSCIGINIVK